MNKQNKIIGCIVARLNSRRLNKKVLKPLGGSFGDTTLLDFLINRAKKSNVFDEIFLCTSNSVEDSILSEVAERHNIKFYAGDPLDVSERLLYAANESNANYIARITGDNPFSFFEFVPFQKMLMDQYDYVRCANLPIGGTIEVFKLEALKKIIPKINPNETEYMMLFLFDPTKLKVCVVYPTKVDFSNISLTVDTQIDFDRFTKYAELLGDKSYELNLWSNLKNHLEQNRGDDELIIDKNSIVKLPNNKTCSVENFMKDMDTRYKQANKLYI